MNIFSSPKKHVSILAYLTLSLIFLSSFATRVFAIDPTCNGGSGIDTALGCIPFQTQGFTAALLGFLAGMAGAISLIIMLIATVQIMTGGDNAEQVKKGKELFTGAITGLFFIIFSVTLLKIVAGDIIQLPGFN